MVHAHTQTLTRNSLTHNSHTHTTYSHNSLTHNSLTQLFVWQAWHSEASTSILGGRLGTWRHRPSLCVAGVALMILGWLWWCAWFPGTQLTHTAVCVACVAFGGIDLHLATSSLGFTVWQAWHLGRWAGSGGALPVTPLHFLASVHWLPWLPLASLIPVASLRQKKIHGILFKSAVKDVSGYQPYFSFVKSSSFCFTEKQQLLCKKDQTC